MFLLSLLLVLTTTVLIILDRHLIVILGDTCWLIAMLDMALMLHMLLNFSSEYAATNGAFQWLWFSWSMLAKLIIYYNFVFNNDDPLSWKAEKARELEHALEFQFALFCIPVLFAIWMFRAAHQLFGPPNKVISIEAFIHMDIIFHVVLDLLDLIMAFAFAYQRDSLPKADQWLVHLNCAFFAVAWFLHSYSFPTGAFRISGLEAAESPSTNESDVFLTRKQVALVSVALVDLPQLFVRTYIWVHYPLSPGLQPFVFKNIVNIPLSTFRLNQCRTAEKTQQEALSLDDIDGGPAWAEAQAASSDESSVASTPMNAEPTTEQSRADTLVTDGPKKEFLSAADFVIDETTIEKPPMEESGLSEREIPIPPHRRSKIHELQGLVDQIESERTIPVRGFEIVRILKKCWHTFTYGARQSIPSRLQNLPPLTYFQTIRLCIPLLIQPIWQVLVLLAHFTPRADARDIENTTLPLALRDEFWIYMTLGASVIFAINFLCFVRMAPIYDVLLCSVGYSVESVMYWVMFRSARTSAVFDIDSPNWHLPVRVPANAELLFTSVLVVPTLWRLLMLLPYLYMGVCHKEFARFIVQKPDGILLQSDADISMEPIPDDEQGYVSVSTLLIFFNCKYHNAPVNLHALLMGPDLIKSTRLCDVLLARDWMRIMMTSLLRILAILLFPEMWSLVMAAVELAYCLGYLGTSQSSRLLSLRRFEVRALFADVLRTWDTLSDSALKVVNTLLADEEPSTVLNNLRSETLKQKGSSPAFLSLVNQIQGLRVRGFFSSPGEVLPPMA